MPYAVHTPLRRSTTPHVITSRRRLSRAFASRAFAFVRLCALLLALLLSACSGPSFEAAAEQDPEDERRTAFVRALELIPSSANPAFQGTLDAWTQRSREYSPRALREGEQRANRVGRVTEGSLVAAVPELPPVLQDDALFTMTLASRAANSRYDRFDEPELWYKEYLATFDGLEWSVGSFEPVEYATRKKDLHLYEEILAAFLDKLDQGGLASLQDALSALGDEERNGDGSRLFEAFASSGSTAAFQVSAPFVENGRLSIALGFFHFQANEMRKNFLFIKWARTEVRFVGRVDVAQLTIPYSDRLRQEIVDGIEKSRSVFVEDLFS